MKLHSEFLKVVVAVVVVCTAGCATIKDNRGMTDFQKGDCKAAVSEWLPLAKKGFAAAQDNMGTVWDSGCPAAGIPQDFGQAFQWYSLAAKNGQPMAMRNLGWYYQHGRSVTTNDNLAREWYVTAARWGNELAKHDLQAMGVPVPPPDLLQQAQDKQAAKSAEVASDVVEVVLGVALGVAVAHHHTAPPAVNAYHGAFTGSQPQNPSTTAYHGAFTGTLPQSPPTPPTPTVNRFVFTDGATSKLRSVGNTIYGTRSDGETWTSRKIGNTVQGSDSTGRMWTINKTGNSEYGRDSRGVTWISNRIGDSTITTYSNGITQTCRVIGDQVTCQ